jgi:hypothetical protein
MTALNWEDKVRVGLNLLIMLILCLPSFATIINVPADQPTIQAAIDSAVDGDTILVAPGIYIENIDFNGTAVALISEKGADSTAIEPLDPDSSTILFVKSEGDGTLLKGFTLRNGGLAHTINIENDSRVEISYNIFHSNIPGVVNPLAVVRIVSYTELHHNVFYNNGGICSIHAAAHSYVFNNTVDSNERGIWAGSYATRVYNNIVSNNTEYGIFAQRYLAFAYNCTWNNGSDNSPGSDGIYLDPDFTQPQFHDYTLNPGSPCIDAGNPDSVYRDPDFSRNDIGAFSTWHNLPLAININLGSEDTNRVISHNPVFYWSFADTLSVGQSGYELEVSSTNEIGHADLWATGQISSPDTSIVYSGTTLEDGTGYHLFIRLHDGVDWGDWQSIQFYMNTQPTDPVNLYPFSYSVIHIDAVSLSVDNCEDYDDDPLTYDFAVHDD